MMKLPFHRKPKNDGRERSSVAFEKYCLAELERRRDTAGGIDEDRFQAAVELAAERIRRLEDEGVE